MSYVKFETTLERPIAELPQLDGLVGKRVEMIVLHDDLVTTQPPPSKPRRQGGFAGGEIWMSPDFDEPMEEFKDYM